MLISKIISGGQTGVDRGAIEAALQLGFPYGGLLPKGRLADTLGFYFDGHSADELKSAGIIL